MQDQADEDLMVLYQQGEVRAFEVLLARHRRPVFNFILRFIGDKELLCHSDIYVLSSLLPINLFC